MARDHEIERPSTIQRAQRVRPKMKSASATSITEVAAVRSSRPVCFITLASHLRCLRAVPESAARAGYNEARSKRSGYVGGYTRRSRSVRMCR